MSGATGKTAAAVPVRLTFWKVLLVLLVGAGLYGALVRYGQGLGAATNLSDDFPWGLWIGFDVLVGVGLAAGGFVIAATVHLFHLKKYEPISRPAILTAFLGYLFVIVALLVDLGQPHRIWHPLIMWNHRSAMFEIGWCVMLYTTVLALEFSPLVLERFHLHVPLKLIRSIYIPLVIAGVLLSTLHQSSLGTLYVIAPDKLHGLWYTPLLPLFFLISAVAGGLAMTIFESYMSHRAFGQRLEQDLLEGLARAAVVVLGVYGTWRLLDLAQRGNFGLIFKGTQESVLFLGEIGLGVALPLVLFGLPALRRREGALFLGAVLVVMGFILYRVNVAVTGMLASSGVSYFPSLLELAVTMSLVAAGFTLFALAVKYLAVFPREEAGAAQPAAEPARSAPALPIFGRGTLVALWCLLLVGFVAVSSTQGRRATSVEAAKAAAAVTPQATPARGALELPPPYAFEPSAESPGRVVFDHATHVDTSAPDCSRCHAQLFSIEVSGRPLRGEWTYERIHEGDLCASCHDGKSATAIEEDCTWCHR